MSLPVALADAVVAFLQGRTFARFHIKPEIRFTEDFQLQAKDGVEVHVLPMALECSVASRSQRNDLATVTVLVLRKLEGNEQHDSSLFRSLDALAEEILDALTHEKVYEGATWQGATQPALYDPEKLRELQTFVSALQLQYRRLWEKPEPTPAPDPTPTPDPDPDPDSAPVELPPLPSVRDQNRFVDIGTTEQFGSADKTSQLSWLYQVQVPIGASYGWDDASGGEHLRSGRHDLSDGKTAARSRFASFFGEIAAANPDTLCGIYWGLKNVRTDAEHVARNLWPCSNSNFERDWGGATTHLQPWLYEKGYTGSWKVDVASAAARQALLDILLGTYLGPGKLYDFPGLRLFHLDEMGGTNNAGAFSAAEWTGIVAFCQEFKPALESLGLLFSGNLGGHAAWNAANPWFAPNFFGDWASMVHLLQQERTPGPKASLTTLGLQTAFANFREHAFAQGLALELHPGLIESDMWPVYTIEEVEVIEGESAWPHDVAYLRDGDRKLLVTLDQDAHAFDWIAETWGSASYIGDQATEATDPWPRSGWSIAKGPTSKKVIVGRQSGDADAVLAGIGGGFAWNDLVGQKLRTPTHWPRIQAAYGLLAIRDSDDVFANHSSAASSVINAKLYAESGEPGVGLEQNWMEWGRILGAKVGGPSYAGDVASGYAGRVRQEFQNGRLDLEPDLGLVTISV